MKLTELFDFTRTIAAPLFDRVELPWEALPLIREYIIELGKQLDPALFDSPLENVWVAKDAKVFPSAYLGAPCIIDSGAEIRHCAFIRGSAIVGKGAVVGNSTELKNVILFDGVQVPHYNYVGDSILGYKAHMGAGSITANVKADRSLVGVREQEAFFETGLKKFGAILADYADVGCNSVMFPGAIIGRRTSVYPLSRVRGVIPPDCIYKGEGNIVERKLR